MKRLIRSCFILVITVSAFACFADEAAELRELNHMILYPIVRNFGESGSDTKCTSLAIAKEQIQNKRQLTEEELDKVFETVDADPSVYETYCKIQIARSFTGCALYVKKDTLSVVGFARSHLSAWQFQVGNCGEYAELAMIAFAFNWINNEKMNQKQMFKGAVIAVSADDTGDHEMILVVGASGTLFVVDPWLRKVMPVLPSFSLPPIIYGVKRHPNPEDADTLYLPSNNAPQLNSLYMNKDSSYYDEIFVKEGTQWELLVDYSKRIQSFAYQYDDDMKKFYNTLKHKFPGWVKDYDKLPLEHSSKQSRSAAVDKLFKLYADPKEQSSKTKAAN